MAGVIRSKPLQEEAPLPAALDRRKNESFALGKARAGKVLTLASTQNAATRNESHTPQAGSTT